MRRNIIWIVILLFFDFDSPHICYKNFPIFLFWLILPDFFYFLFTHRTGKQFALVLPQNTFSHPHTKNNVIQFNRIPTILAGSFCTVLVRFQQIITMAKRLDPHSQLFFLWLVELEVHGFACTKHFTGLHLWLLCGFQEQEEGSVFPLAQYP